MAITAASVDATGYYLSITGTWAASTTNKFWPFADYNLDSGIGGTPRVVLSMLRVGYVRSGGQAVTQLRNKSLVGYKMLRGRTTYEPTTGNTGTSDIPTVDTATGNITNIALREVDNGDGTRTVTIMLSDRVVASDTNVTLAVLNGWRSTESAASGIAVTNNSTATLQLPVLRPNSYPLKIIGSGTFTWDDAIAAHYPEGFDGIAAVKYWLTDTAGTSTADVWVTAQTVSALHGDGLKHWSVTLNPSGLAAGPIMVNRTVYPWVGVSRSFSTTPAATSNFNSAVCERGVPLQYDPAGTRFPAAYVAIDPINGTTTASSGMVFSTGAGATFLSPASKPKDISTAIVAIRLALRTTGVGNAKSLDGARIIIPPYITTPGDNTVLIGATVNADSGTTNLESWLTLEGDTYSGTTPLTPAQARANCRIDCGTATSPVTRATKWRFLNLNLRANSKEFATGAVVYDNVTVDTVDSAQTAPPIVTTTTDGLATGWLCNVTWSNHGRGPSNSGGYNHLARNIQCDKGVSAITYVGFTRLPGAATVIPVAPWPLTTATGDVMWDNIRLNCDLRGVGNVSSPPYTIPNVINTGTTYDEARRLMSINVLVEHYTGDVSLVSGMDSSRRRNTTDFLWENCSMIGDRTNHPYDEPGDCTTLADLVNVSSTATGNIYRGYETDRSSAKSGVYNAPSAVSIRVAAGYTGAQGFCKDRTKTDPFVFGGGMFNSIDNWRYPIGTTLGGVQEGHGYGGKLNPTNNVSGANNPTCLTWPKYVDDRSRFGTAAGFGNYAKAAGAPAIGMCTEANVSRDLAGTERSSTFTAGALEAAPSFGTVGASTSGGTVTFLTVAAFSVTGAAVSGSSVTMSPGVGITTTGAAVSGATTVFAFGFAAAGGAIAGGTVVVTSSTAPYVWTEGDTLYDANGTALELIGRTLGIACTLSGPAVLSGYIKPNTPDPTQMTFPVKGRTQPVVGSTISFTAQEDGGTAVAFNVSVTA